MRALGSPNWMRLAVGGVVAVTNGSLTVGSYSYGAAKTWGSLDQVEVWRQ